MDLTATFVAAAGAKPPANYRFDGVNLLPVMQGDQAPIEDRMFCWRIDRSNRKMRAIRVGKWKYLDDGGTMDLLFNLENDISERENLGYQFPDVVQDLKARLVAWEEEMEQEPKTFTVR